MVIGQDGVNIVQNVHEGLQCVRVQSVLMESRVVEELEC